MRLPTVKLLSRFAQNKYNCGLSDGQGIWENPLEGDTALIYYQLEKLISEYEDTLFELIWAIENWPDLPEHVVGPYRRALAAVELEEIC